MPERFTPKPTDSNYNSRRQSPVSYDHDRYTPPAYGDTNRQKPASPPIKSSHPESRNAPEMFHLDTKGNNSEPRYDEQSFKSSSPLMKNSHPMANDRPELYHLGVGENRSEPMDHNPSHKPHSPPIQTSHASSGTGPELYHLRADDDKSQPPAPRRPSPSHRISPMPIETSNGQGPAAYSMQSRDDHHNHRASPVPMETSNGQGPVVYSIQLRDENHRQTPPMNNSTTRTKLNDTTPFDTDHVPGKITMYSLTTENGENHPPRSPPIISKRVPVPVSYTTKTNNTKFEQTPVRQNAFPTALQDVPNNTRYVPLSQSKASESIQRSMMKYRFNGY